jgi:hypothetical protein
MESDPVYIVKLVTISCIGLAAISTLLAFLFRYPQPLKIFSGLWLSMFCVELVGHYTGSDGEYNNTWIYNIFLPFFYFYLAQVFLKILDDAVVKGIIFGFNYVFIVFVVVNSLFFQQTFSGQLQTHTIVFGGTFIIFLAGVYFWQLYLSPSSDPIRKDPYFWLSLSMILYGAGSVPFLGMYNFLSDRFYEFTQLYFSTIYYGFSITLNVLVIIAFICRIRSLKLS